MKQTPYVRWFGDLRSEDVAPVGGKNASLGELYSALSPEGVQVPNGFALTAEAYRDAWTAGAWARLEPCCRTWAARRERLAANAAQARAIVYAATGTEPLRTPLAEDYRRLEEEYGEGVAVAVRSSATAEDLPTASFAGQHESFLNVRGAGRAVRGLPPLLRLGVHRPRHRLSQRQWLRSSQDRPFRRRDEDGALRPRRQRRGLHARHRIRLPRRRLRHRRLRPRRKHRPGPRRSRRVLRPQADFPRAATAPCCAARWAASSSAWSMPRARATRHAPMSRRRSPTASASASTTATC